MRQPQWAHAGASAWIAHSKESNVPEPRAGDLDRHRGVVVVAAHVAGSHAPGLPSGGRSSRAARDGCPWRPGQASTGSSRASPDREPRRPDANPIPVRPCGRARPGGGRRAGRRPRRRLRRRRRLVDPDDRGAAERGPARPARHGGPAQHRPGRDPPPRRPARPGRLGRRRALRGRAVAGRRPGGRCAQAAPAPVPPDRRRPAGALQPDRRRGGGRRGELDQRHHRADRARRAAR